MKYKINKNLLEEIALQINWKTYTFKEVFDHLDDYVGGVDIDIYDEDGNEIDTWMDRWERFLSDGKPKSLADCIEEACDISGQDSFTTIVGLTNDFPEDDNPNTIYESYNNHSVNYPSKYTAIINQVFILMDIPEQH